MKIGGEILEEVSGIDTIGLKKGLLQTKKNMKI